MIRLSAKLFVLVIWMIAGCVSRKDVEVRTPEGGNMEKLVKKPNFLMVDLEAKKSVQNLANEPNSLWKFIEKGQIVVLCREDFEDGKFKDSGNCSGNCPSVIREAGTQFLRVTLSGTDKVRYRSELSLNQSTPLLLNERAYLFTFTVRFHEDQGSGFPSSMFVQVHSKNWLEKGTNEFWESFVGRVESGSKAIGMWQGERIAGINTKSRFNFDFGEWHKCYVILRLSNSDLGRIAVYRNGVKEFDAEGDNSGNWEFPQFLKVGIYTGKKRPVPVGSSRTIDYDDIALYDITGLGLNMSKPLDIELGFK